MKILFKILFVSFFSISIGYAQSDYILLSKAPESDIYDNFDKWIKITELVLKDEFEYRKSPYKNKRLALLDLRDKFLTGILDLSLLQRIDRPSVSFSQHASTAERLEVNAHQAFYDSYTNLVELQRCLFFADARDHGTDSYLDVYRSDILPCAREAVLGYDEFSSEAREKERESGLRSNDDFRGQIAEEIYDFRSHFMEKLGKSDVLFPDDIKKKQDREEMIYVLEYLVVNNSHEQIETLLNWSLKQGRFPLVTKPDFNFYLIDTLHRFLIRFVQNGGPHDDLKNLELHAEELVAIVKSIMAR